MIFTVDDATYVYDIQGSGPPVLLLHGFTGSRQTWKFIINKLSQSYTLITVDLPGHGQTKADTPRSMGACCHDLNQLLIENGFKNVHILGYSLGGRIALSFMMLYPEMVASLILESASPGLETIKEQKKRQAQDEELALRLEKEGILAFVDFWENIPLFTSQKKLSKSIQQHIRKERLSQSAQGLAESLRSMGTGRQPSWWKRLGEVNRPVLLIVGSLDTKFVAINKQMVGHMKTAHIETTKNSGHAIHVEQPEKFGKIVKRFLNALTYN